MRCSSRVVPGCGRRRRWSDGVMAEHEQKIARGHSIRGGAPSGRRRGETAPHELRLAQPLRLEAARTSDLGIEKERNGRLSNRVHSSTTGDGDDRGARTLRSWEALARTTSSWTQATAERTSRRTSSSSAGCEASRALRRAATASAAHAAGGCFHGAAAASRERADLETALLSRRPAGEAPDVRPARRSCADLGHSRPSCGSPDRICQPIPQQQHQVGRASMMMLGGRSRDDEATFTRARAGLEHEVGAQHARDGPRGATHGTTVGGVHGGPWGGRPRTGRTA
jgi:hypothetical protein